ncbi:MAG: Yip1 family protein [Pseudomonadota bacterium]
MENVTRIPGSLVDDDDYLDNRQSLGTRIFRSWRDMRQATRDLIDEKPNEHRLIFFVLLSDIVFFLSWSLKTVVSPVSGFQNHMPLQIGAILIGALLLRTAAMYVFSLVMTLGARAAGGQGTWRDTRTGIFWAALVAAPFGLIMALVTIAMSWAEPTIPILGSEYVALIPQLLGLLPFLWFVGLGLAEAQGFRSHWGGFLVLLLLAIVAMVGVAVMWMNGIF